MADTFTVGTLGRVRTTGNTVIAGITKWTLLKSVTIVPVPHAEVTADSDGIFWQPHLVGWGVATGTLEGWWNSDSTNQTDGTTIGVSPGLSATLDLIIVRATPHGFSNVPATISNLRVEAPIIDNQPSRFTSDFAVNGSPGRATTVS